MLDSLRALSYLLLPRACAFCLLPNNNSKLDLCAECTRHLPWLDPGCYQCGLPLKPGIDSIRCQDCVDNPPPFDRLSGLFYYQPPINKLINRLKFSQKLYPGELFGCLLSEQITQNWYKNETLPEVIIPVPLHISRLRKRGYNQAHEISLPIAELLKIPIDTELCLRINNTKPQSSLNREKRLLNLSSAFAINMHKPYRHVAIVDDVVTTGSTIKAISNALTKTGVEQIDIWCIARA